MPYVRTLICVCLLALALNACGGAPTGSDVVEQARPGGKVAFDVVDLNDAVVHTVLDREQPQFRDRFKQYVPPPELKIGIGDTIGVVIWESGSEGLFGDSLTELAFPAGATSQLEIEPLPALPNVSALPAGVTPAPDLLATLFGGAVPTLPAAGGAAGTTQSTNLAGAAAALGAGNGLATRQLQQLLDVTEQSGRAGTRIPDQQVDTDGGISIPYAGRIKVAGRTPHEVEQMIGGLLAQKALDPQVLVVDSDSIGNSVSVAGEAITGQRVPLAPGGSRLLDIIAAAGGSKAPVHDTFVQLTRGGVTASAPLATLVSNPAQNIYAEPGDALTLIKRPQTFSVFGATGKNTAITFASDRLSLSEALAKAGGLLDDRADPRSIFLFRYEPDAVVRALGQPVASDAHDGASPVVYRLNLKQAKSYLVAKQFPVHDKDVIFVADAPSQRLYYFFQSLQNVTGPVVSGLTVCQTTKC